MKGYPKKFSAGLMKKSYAEGGSVKSDRDELPIYKDNPLHEQLAGNAKGPDTPASMYNQMRENSARYLGVSKSDPNMKETARKFTLDWAEEQGKLPKDRENYPGMAKGGPVKKRR